MSGEFTDLIIDNMEPDDIADMFFDKDYIVDRKTLNIFDYMQEDVGIERKRADDFVKSFITSKDDHGWDQMNRIAEHEGPAYLIVEGDYDSYVDLFKPSKKFRKPVSEDRFWGAVGSITVRYGIFPIIVTGSEEELSTDQEKFVYLACKIFKSHREGKAGQARKLRVSPVAKYHNVVKALMLTDGIGPEVAESIRNDLDLTFPREILGLTLKELLSVEGVGEKRAEDIVDWWGI